MGSWRRRSASSTSSYPARRPKTDCRNSPANACRPFLPVRASATTSLGMSLNPSTSSSSRYGRNPASEVTTEPRKWSIIRRSKSSLRVSQSERVVEFAINERSSVGGNDRPAKFQPQAVVEIKPENAIHRFTRRRIRPRHLAQRSITL